MGIKRGKTKDFGRVIIRCKTNTMKEWTDDRDIGKGSGDRWPNPIIVR